MALKAQQKHTVNIAWPFLQPAYTRENFRNQSGLRSKTFRLGGVEETKQVRELPFFSYDADPPGFTARPSMDSRIDSVLADGST